MKNTQGVVYSRGMLFSFVIDSANLFMGHFADFFHDPYTEKEFRDLRASNRYEAPMYWVHQLFFEDWDSSPPEVIDPGREGGVSLTRGTPTTESNEASRAGFVP